ncbi:MAG TPA: TolC family protein [Vicinamibacteria bacterium]|nr:TolC family protein [Vicinamibacteria bacterium]
MRSGLAPAVVAALVCAAGGGAFAQTESSQAVLLPVEPPVVVSRLTFDEAVKRAIGHNPTIGQASQAILRAQALLEQAKSVFRPSLYGGAGTTILDAARGFDGNITQPRTQSTFAASLAYPVLAAAGWAAKNQASDQVAIARISAEETRRQVALTAAQSYLAVIAAQRQREIAIRNQDTAKALEDYAKARLDAGKGSRLNHVRSTQELASAQAQLQLAELLVRQAQEALGVAIFADGPVDADGDAELRPAAPPSSDEWMMQRPDVRLSTAQVLAADRVARDSWKAWVPTGIASFTPQYVTPPGFFEPAKTWRAVFQLQIPIYDSTLGPAKRINFADLETSRFRLDAVKVQARSELRVAQESVMRNELVVAAIRLSSESATEALSISEIAYRAGATTNIEVVQAQQTARNAEIAFAVAEDRLRQARLDLLMALGQFPQ